MLPTFVIAGAVKGGSSTLYHYLGQHPDVLMSSAKEPGFFHRHWDDGVGYYEAFFANHNGETAVGEATVGYMAFPEVAPRMRELVPGVKLVFTLRDPVARARSAYWWKVNSGTESRTLDEVLAAGPSEYLIDRSMYFKHLSRFLEFFPRDQVHVVIMEDMAADLGRTLSSTFSFLGVDPDVAIADDGPKNEAVASRSTALRRLVSSADRLGLGRALPGPARRAGFRLVRSVGRANTRAFNPPPLRPDQVERLRGHFVADVEGLEGFLHRRLDDWRLVREPASR